VGRKRKLFAVTALLLVLLLAPGWEYGQATGSCCFSLLAPLLLLADGGTTILEEQSKAVDAQLANERRTERMRGDCCCRSSCADRNADETETNEQKMEEEEEQRSASFSAGPLACGFGTAGCGVLFCYPTVATIVAATPKLLLHPTRTHVGDELACCSGP
jgi:hypothetical protein